MKKVGLFTTALILPLVTFSCGNNKSYIYYQNVSEEGKNFSELIKQSGIKKRMQEVETFIEAWNAGLNRPDNFLKENVKEMVSEIQDEEITNNFKKFGNDIVIEGDSFETYCFQLNENYERVIFYIHGGAYFDSIISNHITVCYKLAKLFNAKVYVPIYPVIPQYFWSICYEFIDKLYTNIVSIEKDKDIIFAGDSAGGGIVLGYSQYIKKEKPNLKLPSARICFSPWCDVTLTNPDAIKNEDVDIMLSVFGLRKCGESWSHYYTSTYDYRISPIYGDLNDKIPTIVFNGTEEIFLPDVEKTCEKLHNNGTRTKLVIGKGLFHAYPIYDLPESKEVLQMAYDFVINGK